MRVFAILALSLLVVACAPREPERTRAAGSSTGIVDRVKVLNADTLVVDGHHVRLANAYAPQQVPVARCWAEGLAAKQATLAVRDMVRSAGSIDVRRTGPKDEYDRAFSLVSLDGLDLGQALIDQGLAAHDAEPRFDWCQPLSDGLDRGPKVQTLFDLGR